jgi:hypothetical protein
VIDSTPQLRAKIRPQHKKSKKAEVGSMDYHPDANQLRRWSERLRRVAGAITEENTRNSLLELARSYDASAEVEEVVEKAQPFTAH